MASQLAWTSIEKALAHLHHQADLLPPTGEVRESSRVATMHPRGWCATEWATRVDGVFFLDSSPTLQAQTSKNATSPIEFSLLKKVLEDDRSGTGMW